MTLPSAISRYGERIRNNVDHTAKQQLMGAKEYES